jgi:opacity protein-like surface antigen
MKKLLVATAVALSLSAAAHAADSTAVLKVAGVLTNDACTPSLDGGGVVDFGTKYVSDLSATDTNQLGNKDLSFTISCSAPTLVAFTISDDRGDSAASVTIEHTSFTDTNETAWAGSTRFGAGKTAGGVNIGAYSVAVNRSAVTGDSQTQTVLRRSAGEVDWFKWIGTSDLLPNDGLTSYSLGDEGGTPAAITTAEFPLRIALAVQKTDALAITDNTTIDGQSTITLIYL